MKQEKVQFCRINSHDKDYIILRHYDELTKQWVVPWDSVVEIVSQLQFYKTRIKEINDAIDAKMDGLKA